MEQNQTQYKSKFFSLVNVCNTSMNEWRGQKQWWENSDFSEESSLRIGVSIVKDLKKNETE